MSKKKKWKIDKPPDRAEWEILLLELIEIADDDDACDIEVVEAEKRLRAAVQRAIDERMVPCMDNDCTDSHILYHEARRNDGDRIRR